MKDTLKLLVFGRTVVPRGMGYSDREHAHNGNCQIELILQGGAVLYTGRTPLSVESGDIVFIPPGIRHFFHYPGDNEMRSLTVQFIWHATAPMPDSVLIIRDGDRSRKMIALAAYLCHSEFPAASDNVNLPAGRFSPPLLAEVVEGILNYYVARRQDTDAELFDEMRRFIHQRGGRPVTVEELAEAVGYSRGHLLALTRRKNGISVKQLIDRERIEIILLQLQYGRRNISEIAGECGFCDVQYFRRFFRKYTGESPFSCLKRARYGETDPKKNAGPVKSAPCSGISSKFDLHSSGSDDMVKQ